MSKNCGIAQLMAFCLEKMINHQIWIYMNMLRTRKKESVSFPYIESDHPFDYTIILAYLPPIFLAFFQNMCKDPLF